MRKPSVLLFALALAASLIFGAAACERAPSPAEPSDAEPAAESLPIVKISVDSGTIPTNATVGDFDIGRIMLEVERSDGAKERIALKPEYVDVAGRNSLTAPGQHMLKVGYGGCVCDFSVVLRERVATRVAKVRGGYVFELNGRPAGRSGPGGAKTVECPEGADSGGAQEFECPDGAEIGIRWIEDSTRRFRNWDIDAGGKKCVDNQPELRWTMTSDCLFVAHSEPKYHEVSFVTLSYVKPATISDRPIIRSNDEIFSEMGLDGYVFAGWTTDEITDDQARNGYSEHIVEFPCEITRKMTFYATWKKIELLYDINYAIGAESARKTGCQVIGYDGTLTDLAIPREYGGRPVISIKDDAFKGRNAKLLETIRIPNSVIEIKPGAFRECTSLRAFRLNEGNVHFSVVDDALCSTSGATVYAYPAACAKALHELKDNVSTVCDYCFFRAAIGELRMPRMSADGDDRLEIGARAFDTPIADRVDFSPVPPLTPDGAERISFGPEPFSAGLRNVCVAESDEEAYKAHYFGADGLDIESKVAHNVSALRAIRERRADDFAYVYREISDGARTSVEIIGASRFATRLAIPDTIENLPVSSIAEYAFLGCISLTDVEFPKTLERICDHAFDDTPWLEGVKLRGDAIASDGKLFKYVGEVETYELGEDITRITESAFRHNPFLVRVNAAKNSVLEEIDAYAFADCPNLVAFDDGASGRRLLIKPALKKIGACAFAGASMESIETRPGSALEAIGAGAFSDNFRLRSASLTSTRLSDISDTAFRNAFALESIEVSPENPRYASFGGILYRKLSPSSDAPGAGAAQGGNSSPGAGPTQGDNSSPGAGPTQGGAPAYELALYPSGKFSEIFNPSRPDPNGDAINVASIGRFALHDANIGALELEESIAELSQDSVRLPAAAYLRFASSVTLNGFAFVEYFAGSGFEKAVFDATLPESEINAFLAGVDPSRVGAAREAPCEFDADEENGLLLAKFIDEDFVRIIGADRSRARIEIPETLVFDGVAYSKKKISKRAFAGGTLTELKMRNTFEIDDFGLYDAFNLVKIDILDECVAGIPAIGADSFGARRDEDLLVCAHVDPEAEGSFLDKWSEFAHVVEYVDERNVPRRFAKNIIYGAPKYVLRYESDNVAHTCATVSIGALRPESLISDLKARRPGHHPARWTDRTDLPGADGAWPEVELPPREDEHVPATGRPIAGAEYFVRGFVNALPGDGKYSDPLPGFPSGYYTREGDGTSESPHAYAPATGTPIEGEAYFKAEYAPATGPFDDFPNGYFRREVGEDGAHEWVPADGEGPEPGATYYVREFVPALPGDGLWRNPLPGFPNGYFRREGEGTEASPHECIPAAGEPIEGEAYFVPGHVPALPGAGRYVNADETPLPDFPTGYFTRIGRLFFNNRALFCEWENDEYLLTLDLSDYPGLTPIGFSRDGAGRYAKKVTFKDAYELKAEFSAEDALKYNFLGWKIGEGGPAVPASGAAWGVALETDATTLRPNATQIEYRIEYDASDPTVEYPAGTPASVTTHYGETFALSAPTRRGYEFLGHEASLEGGSVALTDSSGRSLKSWSIPARNVKVRPVWKSKAFRVTLMDGESVFRECEAEYDSAEYVFPCPPSSEFLGWMDSDGDVYADSAGRATARWDKAEDSALRAVYPAHVSSLAGLDPSASYALDCDVAGVSALGIEYAAIFDGRGHAANATIKATIDDSSDSDIDIGLFKRNARILSNLVLNLDLKVDIGAAGSQDRAVRIGGLCAVNDGIVDGVTVNVRNLEVRVAPGARNLSVFVGGFAGRNSGAIRNSKCVVESFRLSLPESLDSLRVCAGCVAGENSGDIAADVEIRELDVRVGNAPFGGQLATVGSVVGANESLLDPMIRGRISGETIKHSGAYWYKSDIVGRAKKYADDEEWSYRKQTPTGQEIGDWANARARYFRLEDDASGAGPRFAPWGERDYDSSVDTYVKSDVRKYSDFYLFDAESRTYAPVDENAPHDDSLTYYERVATREAYREDIRGKAKERADANEWSFRPADPAPLARDKGDNWGAVCGRYRIIRDGRFARCAADDAGSLAHYVDAEYDDADEAELARDATDLSPEEWKAKYYVLDPSGCAGADYVPSEAHDSSVLRYYVKSGVRAARRDFFRYADDVMIPAEPDAPFDPNARYYEKIEVEADWFASSLAQTGSSRPGVVESDFRANIE